MLEGNVAVGSLSDTRRYYNLSDLFEIIWTLSCFPHLSPAGRGGYQRGEIFLVSWNSPLEIVVVKRKAPNLL